MFDEQVLALEKTECATIADNLNANNAKVAAEQYAQWKDQFDGAVARGIMAPPKWPYPMKAVVNLDANGRPHVEWSAEPIFVEPVPVVVPKPQDTLSYTDSLGVKWHGTITGATPFGLAITWQRA